MPRFVLLRHECPADGPVPSHWDLMLEHEGVLLTWRLAQWVPVGASSESPVATRLADHRLAYLEFEGELSGGRGSVSRADRGGLEWLAHSDDRIEARAAGDQLRGVLELIRIERTECWRLTLRNDPPK